MLTIIHGSDTSASRKYFLGEREKYPESLLIDGEKVTLTDLAQIFEGGGLFGESKAVFIENFFKKEKNKNEFLLLSGYLQKQDSHNIFLWEGKDLEKKALLVFKKAIPRVFKLPQTLFVLLDSIKPGNGKQLISLFHETLSTTEAEMIFFMLIRQTRMLLSVLKSSSDEQIDELRRLAPWQKNKLQRQASLFTPEQLLNHYSKLFQVETAQKTGNLTLPLASSIDFLLLEI